MMMEVFAYIPTKSQSSDSDDDDDDDDDDVLGDVINDYGDEFYND